MIIAVGHASPQALNWLVAHGATVKEYNDLDMIELPKEAQVDRAPENSTYTISFNDVDGQLDDTYVVYELSTDAYETRLTLSRPQATPLGYYQKSANHLPEPLADTSYWVENELEGGHD